jgi:hypothetical protein
MKDFEVHPIGTAEEIRLSRALANEIEQITHQYGKVVPHNVILAYNNLVEHYTHQMQYKESNE